MPDAVSAQHRYLANLDPRDLLARIRTVSSVPGLVIWEMVAVNQRYMPVIAGTETARKLGIHAGEIIGYLVESGRAQGTRPAAGTAIVPRVNQAPPARDFIGSLRWKARNAGT